MDALKMRKKNNDVKFMWLNNNVITINAFLDIYIYIYIYMDIDYKHSFFESSI